MANGNNTLKINMSLIAFFITFLISCGMILNKVSTIENKLGATEIVSLTGIENNRQRIENMSKDTQKIIADMQSDISVIKKDLEWIKNFLLKNN